MDTNGTTEEVRSRSIARIVGKRLSLVIFLAFALTTTLFLIVGIKAANDTAQIILSLSITDAQADISEKTDREMLSNASEIAGALNTLHDDWIDSAVLGDLAAASGATEINVVGTNNVILASNVPANIGFDMSSGEQSREFSVLLDGSTTEYVQELEPTAKDPNVMRKYAGYSLANGGYVQLGLDMAALQKKVAHQVEPEAHNRHVGETGSMIIADESKTIVSDSLGMTGMKLSEAGMTVDQSTTPQSALFEDKVQGQSSLCMYTTYNGYYIIAQLPLADVNASFLRSMVTLITVEILGFGGVFIVTNRAIKSLAVRNIIAIKDSLATIAGGNLDEVVNVSGTTEFEELSRDINSTVNTLKSYGERIQQQMSHDLAIASQIQSSALPRVFPAFPRHPELDLYATMTPAKYVGGDFYDYMTIDDHRIGVVIADVSGKGVPAALFMMSAKTQTNSLIKTVEPLEAAIAEVNDSLCNGNDAEMFVTLFAAIIDVEAQTMTYVNAGHNYPLIRHAGAWEWVNERSGLVLGAMPGMTYTAHVRPFCPGDLLLLYTDGVTEAFSANEEAYGDDRLAAFASDHSAYDAAAVLEALNKDVGDWSSGAERSDDITMLALRFCDLPGTEASQGDDTPRS